MDELRKWIDEFAPYGGVHTCFSIGPPICPGTRKVVFVTYSHQIYLVIRDESNSSLVWMGLKRGRRTRQVSASTNGYSSGTQGNAVTHALVATESFGLHGCETKNPESWQLVPITGFQITWPFSLTNELLPLCEVKDFLCISFQDTPWSNCFSTSCCTMPSRRVPSTWDGNCTPTSYFPVVFRTDANFELSIFGESGTHLYG